jgi:hypothetical protein
MKSLITRVEALEEANRTWNRVPLFVLKYSDGRLKYDGQFYESEDALIRALELEQDTVKIIPISAGA